MGYCQDIFDPQERHFPFWKRKLNSGMSSRALNLFPQEKQAERPNGPLLPPRRRVRTLRKLPMAAPNKKKNIMSREKYPVRN